MDEQKPKKKKKAKEPDLVIPLRKPYTQLVLGVLFFGACAAFMFHRSSTNDRGLILNGVIHFDPGGADVFYAVMGLLSSGFVAMAVLGILSYARLEPFQLVIGAKSLSMPANKPMGIQVREVPMSEVMAIGVHPPQAPKSVFLQLRGGVLHIPGNWLPGGWSVAQVHDALVERLRQQAEAEASAAAGE